MGVNKSVPSLVFFGTGPVAAKSLELLAKNFVIEAIITKPKPAHHKGEAPVLEIAKKLEVKLFTASSKQELDELFASKPVTSQLAVLIDFGIIISPQVIDYFPIGIINSHFSILPDLRGADPITFAILSGQKQTGVSLMKVVEAMDEGPIFGYGEHDLSANTTTPELTDRLISLSDALLTHDLPLIYSGQLTSAPQSVTGRKASYSRRLTKEDGVIDWHKPAKQIEREIRAFVGWPGSRTKLGEIDVIITKANVLSGEGKVGDFEVNKDSLTVQTSDGRLSITQLKPVGKNEMAIQAFLAGYRNKVTP